jgi:uncharacterized membrane protein
MDIAEFIILQILGGIFMVAGAALIMYGGVRAAIKILLPELGKRPYLYNKIRNEFTSKIVFGLEFLFAADILRILAGPAQQEFINLAVVDHGSLVRRKKLFQGSPLNRNALSETGRTKSHPPVKSDKKDRAMPQPR